MWHCISAISVVMVTTFVNNRFSMLAIPVLLDGNDAHDCTTGRVRRLRFGESTRQSWNIVGEENRFYVSSTTLCILDPSSKPIRLPIFYVGVAKRDKDTRCRQGPEVETERANAGSMARTTTIFQTHDGSIRMTSHGHNESMHFESPSGQMHKLLLRCRGTHRSAMYRSTAASSQQ